MTYPDREVLTAALSHHRRMLNAGWDPDLSAIYDAATRQLAQLPEKCERCNGKGIVATNENDYKWETCPTCHGKRSLYPSALVERIAEVIAKTHRRGRVDVSVAVAVFDALNSNPAPEEV